MDNLSKKGLILKGIFQQFAPGSIQDLIEGPYAVTVVLRDGGLLLAQLDEGGSLHLGPIDTAC